jgi:hypothetical protein
MAPKKQYIKPPEPPKGNNEREGQWKQFFKYEFVAVPQTQVQDIKDSVLLGFKMSLSSQGK